MADTLLVEDAPAQGTSRKPLPQGYDPLTKGYKRVSARKVAPNADALMEEWALNNVAWGKTPANGYAPLQVDANGVLSTAIMSSNVQFNDLEYHTLDFRGKKQAQVWDVPHYAANYLFNPAAASEVPTNGVWSEIAQARYDALGAEDGNLFTLATTTSGYWASCYQRFDLLAIAQRRVKAMVTVAELRTLIQSLVLTWKGYGTGANAGALANGVTLMLWNKTTNVWDTVASNTNGVATTVTLTVINFADYIDDSGRILLRAKSPFASDGVNTAALYIDYAKADVAVLAARETVKVFNAGFRKYNADSLIVTGTGADASTYTFDFPVQKVVFIKNDGPNDVVLGFGVSTETAKRAITLKAGESLDDDPLGDFATLKAKLTTAGSATLRFKVVG